MTSQGKRKGTAKLPRTPQWPDALPSEEGSKFVFGLNCGNTSLSWSLLDHDHKPILIWTTNPPLEEDSSSKALSLFRYLPDQVQTDMIGFVSEQQKRKGVDNATLCSSLLQRRETVLTVYMISSNPEHEKAAVKLFDGLPAVIYRLSHTDLLRKNDTLTVYDAMGNDRIAGLMGAHQCFPNRRSHLVIDGGTALTITTITQDNRIGGAIGVGPRIKLASLASATASLPDITENALNDMIRNLASRGGKLETFNTSNTIENMVGFVFKETTIFLAHVIQEWRKSLPKDIPIDQTPVVVLCGGDGQLLSGLLRPGHKGVFETSPETTAFLETGEFYDRLIDCDVPKSPTTAFQVVHHRHLIHLGIQYVLEQNVAKTPVNDVRKKLVGHRVVNLGKRGTIVSVKRSKNDDDLKDDMFSVYVEKDKDYVEMDLTALIGESLDAQVSKITNSVVTMTKDGLEKYSEQGEIVEKNKNQTIGALNKMKDARGIHARLQSLLKPNVAENEAKPRAKDPPNTQAPQVSVPPAAAALKPAPPNPGNAQANTQIDKDIQNLLDALLKLYNKRRLQMKTLVRMSEDEVKAVVKKAIVRNTQKDPSFAKSLDTEAQRMNYLRSIDSREKTRKDKARSATGESSSAKKASVSSKQDEPASSNKPLQPSSTKKTPKRDEPTGAKKPSSQKKKKPKLDQDQKEALVGQRVAKYFRNEHLKNQLYPGKVVAFFPSKDVEIGVDLWQIRFDDGDEEDVEYKEVVSIVAQYRENRHLFLKQT